MSLTGQIRDQLQLTHVGTNDLGTLQDDVVTATNYPSWTIASGTGAGLADIVFRDQRTLALSTSEDLDLAGGLTDAFGATLTFVKVKMLYVSAATANDANIVVGGASSNAFLGAFADATDKVNLPASAWLKWTNPTNGYSVTAGTGDILKIENSDGAASATYDIVIVGTSA